MGDICYHDITYSDERRLICQYQREDNQSRAEIKEGHMMSSHQPPGANAQTVANPLARIMYAKNVDFIKVEKSSKLKKHNENSSRCLWQ
jgi:hypothetical protein